LGDGSLSEHHQVIVIGSGSGGKEAAILTARAGLQVLLQKESSAVPVFIAVVTPFELYGRARCTMEQPKGVFASGDRSFVWKKQYGQIRLARRDRKRKAPTASGQRSRHHLRQHTLTFRILCLTMTSELALMAKRALMLGADPPEQSVTVNLSRAQRQ
jgi:Glucose inhibited division protein A